MTSTAATALYAVVGWPVRHSLSPVMHDAAFRATGLDATYVAFEVPPERLKRAIKGAGALGLAGLNVTIPHKEAACALCTVLTNDARRLGAVNTISFEQDLVIGHNTDAQGFLRALQGGLGFDPQGRRAVVLGAGGSARAVVGALFGAGADDIAVAARTPVRGELLVQALATGKGRVLAWAEEPMREALASADLVVSCLPADVAPVGLEALGRGTAVLDLVYARETALLSAARMIGARAVDGLEMLVQQGALAFERWTGRAAPVQVMRDAALAALAADARVPCPSREAV